MTFPSQPDAKTGAAARPEGPRQVRGGMWIPLAVAVLVAWTGGSSFAQGSPPEARGEGTARSPALARLLRDFAAMPGLTARFEEEKRMALLAVPLTSRGEIAFAPPDRLRRQVTEPVEALMLVRDGEMVLRDPNGSRVIDLASQPMVQIFVDGITRLLAGDLDGLEAHYRMRFEPGNGGGNGTWSLQLEPTVAPLDDVIASIRFEGRGHTLDTLTVIETSGDETRTRFSDVDGERHFSQEEIERLFQPHEHGVEGRAGPAPGR